MKTPARHRFIGLAVALSLTLTFAMTAQETPSSPENTRPPAAPAAPATPEPADEADEGELRRLDVPTPAAAENEPAIASDEDADAAEDTRAAERGRAGRERRFDRHHVGERVNFWRDSTLAENESASMLVSIFGSSTSAGSVREAVVSILGSSTSSGEVGEAVVSVLGGSRVTGGHVREAVVSVLGNTYVNGRVDGEVVAVLGNVELGPDADIGGEIVCVGGTVIRHADAQVHGPVNNVAIGVNFGGFEWLHSWVRNCLVMGRPLAFAPNLMWAWWIAFGFLAMYFVIALVAPRGVEKCSQTLERSPGYSLLTALLITLLTPLAMVVLAITVVGTPALLMALFAAGVFGKVVMLDWIGRRLAGLFGGRAIAPAGAVLLGGVLVLLLYTIPIVGFVVAKLIAWIGLGVVAYTVIQAMNRPKAAATAAAAGAGGSGTAGGAGIGTANTSFGVAGNVAAPVASVGAVGPATPPVAPAGASAAAGAPMMSAGFGSEAVPPVTPGPVPPVAPPPVAPVAAMSTPISAAMLPRAGFWIRIAASMLDILIVAIAGNLIPDAWQPNLLLIFAAYCCVLWATKGTTVGGIICGLRVVRLDERPIDWPTALVRTLGGFLSLVAAGIGFIWVAFDDQKQSWHDKIAGTTIVHVPRGVSLV